MEELNKNQIVLLTLLVSFVTSIATGIVTVTLMDQAPPPVTQTVNRVVERTIERVVPGENTVSTVIKEVPVVITEEKLIVDVINNTSPSIVRIVGDGDKTITSGFLVAENTVATVASFLNTQTVTGSSRSRNPRYTFYFNDGKKVLGRQLTLSKPSPIALFQLDMSTLELAGTSTSGATTTPDSPAVVSASLKPLTLVGAATEVLPGQTVVALGLPDDGPISVSGGLVSSVSTASDLILTGAVTSTTLGGPLLNTKGVVIGLNKDNGAAFSAKLITDALATVVK